MAERIRRHPLIGALLSLRGNARACVYTEPLWGIPFFLYTPFVTLYMHRLGVGDARIGLIASAAMAFQIVFSLLSGPITDKLGRRKTTLFCDLLSWSVPVIVWAFARDFWWFLAAAVLNGVSLIGANSWTCLLVESAEHDRLIDIYTWVTISGLLAAFLAPVSGALVQKYSVVPVMRALYIFAFVLMTAKFVTLYIFSAETARGKERMAQARGVPLWRLAAGSGSVLAGVFRNRQTACVVAIYVLFNIQSVVAGNFFPLYVTGSLGVPDSLVAYFPIIRSAVMLAFLFGVQHLLVRLNFRAPMFMGLGLYFAGTLLLILPWAGGLARPILYTLFESFAFAIVSPRKDSLVIIFVDPKDRARIMGAIYALMLALSAPFGWIAGALSSVNRAYPFYLNLGVFLAFVGAVGILRDVKTSERIIP
ncbi:MAG: MFS transporter [Firmicutes bacterium]|nr:MFS transporter [Bacillota bacterium]